MSTAIIVVILVLIGVFSVRSYKKKLSSGCCGAGDDAPKKKVKVRDKNPEHYSKTVKIGIDGMTCTHCKTRVENALNSEEGVWAEVDLEDHSATVRMKNMISEDALRHIIGSAGYLATYIDAV